MPVLQNPRQYRENSIVMGEVMEGTSRLTPPAWEQAGLKHEVETSHRAEDDPQVVLMFRDVVKTALAYTAHLSWLFVFRISDEEISDERMVKRSCAQPASPGQG